MTFLGRVLLRLVFWLGVLAAVAAVTLACVGTVLRREARTLAYGRPGTVPRSVQPILR